MPFLLSVGETNKRKHNTQRESFYMTKNRGQASLGKTVEPNGDSEIEIDDQEVT